MSAPTKHTKTCHQCANIHEILSTNRQIRAFEVRKKGAGGTEPPATLLTHKFQHKEVPRPGLRVPSIPRTISSYAGKTSLCPALYSTFRRREPAQFDANHLKNKLRKPVSNQTPEIFNNAFTTQREPPPNKTGPSASLAVVGSVR